MGATRRAFRQKSASRRRPSYTSLSARAPEAIPGRSARFSALELRHRGFQPVGPLRRRVGPQQQLRAQRETDTLSLRRLPPRKPKGRRFSPACQSKSRTLLPPRQAGLPQPPVRHFPLVCRIGSNWQPWPHGSLQCAEGHPLSRNEKGSRRVFRRDVEDSSPSQGRKPFSGFRGGAPGACAKECQAEGSSHPRFMARARSAGSLPGGDRLFGIARRLADPKGRPRRLGIPCLSGFRRAVAGRRPVGISRSVARSPMAPSAQRTP